MTRGQVKKGEITLLTIGKKDDYGINELVRALKDFDIKTVVDEWALANARLNSEERNKPYYHRKSNGLKLADWLRQQGYTEKIEYRELNTGYDEDEVDVIDCE
ncbi:hypothetical protein [Shewanella baltica]|uniref:hypothetical protein n=1 Tax=Shewanella baltica TaxID=62322 RepID=UPI00217D9981|nr:hypothetical protein [Shewanella baltica]MCS6101399.1 hypothetical protein [Shewanella baltica]MCS6184487.1 hypothetical protein [Shewanella baltica]